ncbi:DUF222 domain-containing protein [Microbacterium oryzae]|uniref:HNH endonuclease signature motif containing protein n=1 Tax=Microbacterium oryzae TaxID=743009 RepID=UPI0025AFD188|nr:HNH endonuclease signature motif containing protein [Microbacterium oryzae]MDN3310764.1 DUF222 domain-containing protein [Microbacterium oryzae]
MVKDASPVSRTAPATSVGAVAELLDGVFGLVEQLPDAELVALTGHVEQLGRMVDAVRVRTAGEVTRRSRPGLEHPLSEGLGCRTGREVLERVTGVPGVTLSGRARLDERTRQRESATGLPLLPERPVLAAALAAGRIGVEPAALLVKAFDTASKALPAEERYKVDAMEAHLVGIATGAISSDLDDAALPDPLVDLLDPATETAADAAADTDGDAATCEVLPPPWSVVKAHADAWVDVLTADGFDPDHEHDKAFRARSLTVTELPNGNFRVNGVLVPEAGALLQILLAAHTNPARAVAFAGADGAAGDGSAPTSDANADGADGTEDADAGAGSGFLDGLDPEDQGEMPWQAEEIVHDPRTATQKRHDALVAMLYAASRAAETPTLGGAAPTVMIHITCDDLTTTRPDADADAGTSGRSGWDGSSERGNDCPPGPPRPPGAPPPPDTPPPPSSPPWSPPQRRHSGIAHLDGASRAVPASVARRIGCSGDILRAVYAPNGRILSLTSVQRTFTATQRKAIVARDGGCIIPGCTIPAAWCEIHHVQDHARGGPTHTDNGVLLCWWHHHHLEHSGWDIQMRNGTPYIAAPNWIDRHHRYRPAPTSTTRLHTRIRGR